MCCCVLCRPRVLLLITNNQNSLFWFKTHKNSRLYTLNINYKIKHVKCHRSNYSVLLSISVKLHSNFAYFYFLLLLDFFTLLNNRRTWSKRRLRGLYLFGSREKLNWWTIVKFFPQDHLVFLQHASNRTIVFSKTSDKLFIITPVLLSLSTQFKNCKSVKM